MSFRALSRGFSWYSMPCLVHRDFTSGAILCKLCRGMVGKRLGDSGRQSVRGLGTQLLPTCPHGPRSLMESKRPSLQLYLRLPPSLVAITSVERQEGQCVSRDVSVL